MNKALKITLLSLCGLAAVLLFVFLCPRSEVNFVTGRWLTGMR